MDIRKANIASTNISGNVSEKVQAKKFTSERANIPNTKDEVSIEGIRKGDWSYPKVQSSPQRAVLMEDVGKGEPSKEVNLSSHGAPANVSSQGVTANIPMEGLDVYSQNVSSASSPKSIAVLDEKESVKAHDGVKETDTEEVDESIYVPGKDAELINVKSTVANMEKLARAVRLGDNVLMVGPTGAGKTSLVKYLAYLTGSPLRRVNLNDMTDITEIIGGYKPNEQGRPQWQDGVVVQAMKRGEWLLLDEINLADPAILERLNSLLDDDRYLVLTEKNNEIVKAHPDFRVFCTMNPASYAGRKKLSKAMMNRLKKIWIDGLEPEEMVEVIKTISKTPLSDKMLLQMAMFHQTVADMAEHRQIGKRDGPYPFTLRDMLKWTKRINHFHKTQPNIPLEKIVWREARRVYEDRFIKEADRAVIEDTLKLTFGESAKPDEVNKEIVESQGKVKIGDVELDVNPKGGAFVPSEKAKLVHVKSTVDMLEKMAKCVKFDEPVLLVGPTAAGKTAKVKYLARLTNNNLRRYNLSMQTDTTEFIGGYKPTGVPGEYKWVDGILVDAMKKGDWVVLDEINLAEPSILERINSLLDGDRALVLSEKNGEIVKAHPNFRIFATMNPATSEYSGRKELSLAMRNRFTEIWDPGLTDRDELVTVMKIFLKGVPDGDKLAPKMVDFQMALQEKVNNKELAAKQREGFVYTIRNLVAWVRAYKDALDESKPEQAFAESAEYVYASEFSDKADRKYVVEMAKRFYKADNN